MKDTAFPELEGDDEAITAFMENSIAITQAALCDEGFEADVQEIADIIERPDNLGALRQRGEWHYNFHRSAEHPRGLWRRLAVSQVPEAGAGWESVFDLDAFCTETGGDWHWNGVRTLHSNPERVLIALSYQGSDQNRYLEWDCTAAAPVPGGFDLAPARGNAEWLDADSLLVSTADLPGAATRSGWQGRTVRLTRGTALVDAPVVFEVDYEDLVASAYTFPLADGSRGVGFARVRNIGDVVTTVEMAGAQTTIKAPPNTDCAHNDTHYAFVAGDKGSYPAGTLVLGRIGGGDRQVLFSPSTRCAVDEGSLIFYRNHLFWLESDTMVPTIMRLDLRSPDARPAPLPLPVNAEEIWLAPHSDPDGDDGPLQLTTSGFLSPSRTWLFDGTAVDPVYELLVSSPASFDATGMEVRLHMARSEDGTEVPYHIVLPKGYENSSVLPILQYGYGGFSAALAPRYLRTEGPLWLARGGAYVMAYIRGGSEFGRSWHFAAKREYRKNAYSDFASIADDLVARGYTSPNKIACHGSS
ncbi:MAG: prolyl oligopeptidase family serine peptidase, partial [Pseudomonadota bacterium]